MRKTNLHFVSNVKPLASTTVKSKVLGALQKYNTVYKRKEDVSNVIIATREALESVVHHIHLSETIEEYEPVIIRLADAQVAKPIYNGWMKVKLGKDTGLTLKMRIKFQCFI